MTDVARIAKFLLEDFEVKEVPEPRLLALLTDRVITEQFKRCHFRDQSGCSN